jgi:ADP-ribosylglycohydrolase
MATGDALGVPTSFLTPSYIRERWGWVDTFYPPEKGHIFHDGLQAGEYTDDTEQALALIKSFTRHGKVVPEDIVKEILAWAERVKDKYASPLGPSTERALKAIAAGVPIHESGRRGNTNGAAMRISPLGIIHGLRGSALKELAADVYLTCIPTHNTRVCVASAAAVAWGVASCIRGEKDLFAILHECAKAAEEGGQYGNDIPAPSVSRRVEFIGAMIQKGGGARAVMAEMYDLFGGGDLAADSIPVAVGLFVLGKGDPKQVNELCVNFGGDCDTNAAMAGAMAGAYSGLDAVPPAWRETIKQVNHVELESYGRELIEVSGRWNTGESGAR